MNEWYLYVGEILWVYNSTMLRSTGLSPGMFLMDFVKVIRSKLKLGERAREMWRLSNEKFNLFKTSDKVLKSKIGR